MEHKVASQLTPSTAKEILESAEKVEIEFAKGILYGIPSAMPPAFYNGASMALGTVLAKSPDMVVKALDQFNIRPDQQMVGIINVAVGGVATLINAVRLASVMRYLEAVEREAKA